MKNGGSREEGVRKEGEFTIAWLPPDWLANKVGRPRSRGKGNGIGEGQEAGGKRGQTTAGGDQPADRPANYPSLQTGQQPCHCPLPPYKQRWQQLVSRKREPIYEEEKTDGMGCRRKRGRGGKEEKIRAAQAARSSNGTPIATGEEEEELPNWKFLAAAVADVADAGANAGWVVGWVVLPTHSIHSLSVSPPCAHPCSHKPPSGHLKPLVIPCKFFPFVVKNEYLLPETEMFHFLGYQT